MIRAMEKAQAEPPETVADREAADLDSAQAVQELARRMFGGEPRFAGVIHPTAVRQAAEGEGYQVLKITDQTPKSHHDAFSLNLARARADAILTTGKILRQEPGMTHEYLGSAQTRKALADWRETFRGKTEPPWSVVLTSGRDVDFGHPLFEGVSSSRTRVILYTGEEGKKRLAGTERPGLRVVDDPHPSPRRAIAWLQRQGLGTISIEAGPSSSGELYKPAGMVDELLLSVYEGPLPEKLRGGEFLTPEALRRYFRRTSKEYRVQTTDGVWRFRRFG